MSAQSIIPSKRLLDPQDRAAEVLFGLIMVLTFTGSLSAAEAGRTEIRAMLVGALGCNFAWGLIDGILYLMGTLAGKGRELVSWKAVRSSSTPETAHRIIADALPPMLAGAIHTPQLELMRRELVESPEPPERARLDRNEWLAALGIFLWVFLVTFPVAIPFIVMRDAWIALRVSNGIAVVMLFFAGYFLGRYAGFRAWRVGIGMVLLGTLLVGITMALGG